jgi:hypothetical protein
LFGLPFEMVSRDGVSLGTGKTCLQSITGCDPRSLSSSTRIPERPTRTTTDKGKERFEMNRIRPRRSRAVVAAGIAALAALAGALVAGPSASAAGDPQQVPFHADLDFAATASASSAPCAPNELRVDITITGGTVSHLGSITSRDYYGCLDPSTLRFYGRYVFVAANGDSIDGGYAGRFVPTADPGVLAVDARWFVDGGTGRFAGATGGGTASGSGTTSGGRLVQDGAISSVGSRK